MIFVSEINELTTTPAPGVMPRIQTVTIWVSYQAQGNHRDLLRARCPRARARRAIVASKVRTLKDRRDLSCISMLLQV